MARGREKSPERIRAFEIWKDSGGKKPLKEIAAELGVSDTLLRKWKSIDSWEAEIGNVFGNVTDFDFGNVTKNVTKKKGAPIGNKNAAGHGAPPGNKNAVGNKGGYAKPGNKNAERHGFFSRIFPDDAETREIIESIDIKSPLEMLWENIVIQYTAIARAQRIMYVKDQNDLTKVLKRHKSMDTGTEKEWELQFAWDKQAAFLQAQSRAMATLQGMLARYEEMLRSELVTEEQQLKLEKMRAEIDQLRGGIGDDDEAPQFIDDIGSDDDAGN